ncbi:MAG: PGF-pre-PGF domain-containing protein [Candidatus Woesearchaeota archaeon]
MKKLLLALMIALIIITTSVHAQENFDAYGQPEINTFQCSTHESKITVINSGTTSSTYFMEVEGSAAKWAEFAPATFVLSPGQSIEVKSYLRVPCNAKGKYTLDTYIVTADGLEKAIPQDISVEKPQNIDIRANIFSQSINPCQTATYNLTIINPLDFTEDYTLSVDKFKNETFFSDEKLTLQGKSSKDVLIEIEPQSCMLSGAYDIVFSAKAEKTGVKAEIDLALDISDKGIASIADGVSKIKTDYSEKEVELQLVNKGKEETEYELIVVGPDWVSILPDTLTIEGEKSKTFKLKFVPSNEISKGKYPVKIIAKADTGAKYTKEIIVQLGEPTIFNILIKDYPIPTFVVAIIIIGLIILGVIFFRKYNSEEAKNARAKKKAEKAKKKEELRKQRELEKKRLELEKERQQRIKELEKKRKEAQLEAERQKAIKKYDKQIKSEYKLIPKDEIIEGKKMPGRRLWNLILLITILLIIGTAIKFRTFFYANKWYVLLGIIILIILYIIKWLGGINRVTARWKGLVLANETLLVDVNWRKGLQQMSFALSSPAEKLTAVIKKGRTRYGRYFKPKDYVYQYFRVESSVDEIIDEIKESRFRFKVDKKWLAKRQVDEKNISLAVLQGDKYNKLKTVRETSDEKFVYYKADADCFGQFAIIGKTNAKEKQKPYWIAWLLIGILAILAIIIGLNMLFEPKIEAKGIPVQVWDVNGQHKINLTQYFSDPDNDVLNFTAAKVSNIDIQVTDGIAYLTPDYDWSGQRITTFYADDGKGGTAQSNPVKLVVKKKIVPSAASGYVKYVLAGIIILIVLIAFLILRKPILKWLEEEEKDY